ncbi:probable pectate lyase P59 [Abrus precatorius]|uniref:Pectate lyase n=1 Tax=Abrus precatorius TaxID=3816 RepID=A0A8B8JZD4_ABRPR|nr:probable pectate lyase P59 [Abrus precatorius]
MEANKFSLLFFYIFYFAIFPTLKANIGHFDKVWYKRSQEAKKTAQHAFKSNPEKVTVDFNMHVSNALKGTNNTRRGLAKYNGPCKVTNPIDGCWRCDPNWANNRKKLASCAIGFGHGTTGGKDGKFYVVTDPSDNDLVNPKRGTLRHAAIQEEPLWIIFARSMNIKLNGELLLTDNKTIDARGANVHISNGAQITLQFVKNIIIHGLHIHDIKKGGGGLIRDSVKHFGLRTVSDGDGISLFGATHVWLDHLSMTHCDDGLIDVIMGSTAITISNSHFTNHNDVIVSTFYFVMLFGANDGFSGDKVMQVTLAFNHFGKGLVQRMPRCRWGFFHIVNNDYTHWLMYAIGGSQQPTIISQGNRFVAPQNPAAKEVTKRDRAPESVWKTWNWRSEGDLMMNGAFFIQSGKKVANLPKIGIQAKPAKFVSSLTRFAGSLKCEVKKPC